MSSTVAGATGVAGDGVVVADRVRRGRACPPVRRSTRRAQAGPDAGIPFADKVAHLFLFASVAFLGLRVGVPARWLLAVLVANAVVSELVQHFLLPQRSGDPFDALADLAGARAGCVAGIPRAPWYTVAGHDMMGA